MRALWSTASDRVDSGNNILGSKAIAEVYDCAIGIGPFASESLTGEYQSVVEHKEIAASREVGDAALRSWGVPGVGVARAMRS